MKDKKKIIFCLVALIIIVVVLIIFFVFKDNKLINNNKNKTITENGVQLIVQNDNVISIKKNKKESNLLEFNLTNKTESISNYTM